MQTIKFVRNLNGQPQHGQVAVRDTVQFLAGTAQELVYFDPASHVILREVGTNWDTVIPIDRVEYLRCEAPVTGHYIDMIFADCCTPAGDVVTADGQPEVKPEAKKK
jgi:hypothetical protein